MNHLLEEAHGIDAAIKRLQSKLYPALENLFSNRIIEGYGKVYRYHEKGRDYIPKRYNVETGEYKDVFWSDYHDLQFCFIPANESTTSDEVAFVNKTKVVFSMDLEKLYPNFDGRADGLAQKKINALFRELCNSQVTGIQTGIDRVYQNYVFDKAHTDDMSKVHTFAILINLNFYLTDNC